MKTSSQLKMLALLLLVPVTLIGLHGCGALAGPPVPESVLAGDWELTTVNPSNLPRTVLTFDSNGVLTNMAFTVGGATVNQTPINGSTTVNGTSVAVSQNLPNGGSMNFQGTLNSDNTQVTGNMFAVMSLTNIFSTTLPGVPATMTKL